MTAPERQPTIGAVYRSNSMGNKAIVISFDEKFVWTAHHRVSKRQLQKLLGTERGPMTSRREFAEDMRRIEP